MQTPDRPTQVAAKAAGFTLTELLLVIVIVALVGGLGGGIYSGTYKKLLVDKAARQFLLMARYGRIMAIERQRPYELHLDPTGKGFLLATTEMNQDTGQTERVIVSDYYCKPVEFEGDVRFEDVVLMVLSGEASPGMDQEQKIVFLPNGSAESAIVQIGDGKTHYAIAVVAATGKATMCEGTVTDIRTASIDLDMQGMP